MTQLSLFQLNDLSRKTLTASDAALELIASGFEDPKSGKKLAEATTTIKVLNTAVSSLTTKHGVLAEQLKKAEADLQSERESAAAVLQG